MNLIEARKQAHEGWVRSPTRTDGLWYRAIGTGTLVSERGLGGGLNAADLDAEDWEPKPAPKKPFEAEVWVHVNNNAADIIQAKHQPEDTVAALLRNNWRKIRVREVVE